MVGLGSSPCRAPSPSPPTVTFFCASGASQRVFLGSTVGSASGTRNYKLRTVSLADFTCRGTASPHKKTANYRRKKRSPVAAGRGMEFRKCLKVAARVSPSSQILVRTWLPWVPKLHLKLGSATIFKRSSPCVPNFGVCILQSFHGGSRKLGARDSLRAIFAGSLGTTRAVRHKQPTSLLDTD